MAPQGDQPDTLMKPRHTNRKVKKPSKSRSTDEIRVVGHKWSQKRRVNTIAERTLKLA